MHGGATRLFTLAPMIAAALAIGVPTPAGAQPTAAQIAEARHSVDVAVRAFDAGDYATAATEFRTAWELTQHPDLLYNIYLSEERAGRLPEARDALALYLDRAEVEPDQRPLLERRLARIRERIARGTSATPERDERPGTTGPGAQPPGVGSTQLASAEVEGRLEELIRTTLVRETERARAEGRAEAGDAWRTAGIGTLIAGGVLALSFVVFATLSEIEDQALAGECGRDAGAWCTSDRLGALGIYNFLADASWIAASLAGTVGLVLLLTAPGGAPRDTGASASIAPFAGPDGGGFSIGGRM